MSDVVVVTSSGSGQTGAGSGANKVTEVARIVGGQDENSIRAQALSCINRVRMELNMHDWRFMKTNASNITLVNGTATYTLPTNLKAICYARLLDTAGKQDHELTYVSDDIFTKWIRDQEHTGQPIYYNARNAFGDGLISVYPVPDASAATTWTLDVEYFKRIPVITDDATQIDVPEEVNLVLAVGGQMYLLEERDKSSPVLPAKIGEYGRVFGELRAMDRRVHDERPRFRIGSARQTLGTLYIKIQ